MERKNGKRNGNANGHPGHARLEYFWLCWDCALRMTLETERGSGLVRVAESKISF